MTLAVVEASDALHARVGAFVRGESEESFEALALDIARHQARFCPGFQRLIEARGATLNSTANIPAVPTDVFRIRRVAAHPADLDSVRFVTSGTTGSARGVHALRRTDTYREIALAFGRRALVGGAARQVVVALAAHPGSPPTSSLGFMMRAFMQDLDGRALASDPDGAAFDADSPARWLVRPEGVDVAGVRRAALIALERQEPLLVLATSFALLSLLDELGSTKLRAPKQSVVMLTGGFKGRTRSVNPEKLRRRAAKTFGIPTERVVNEYGMTELTSQLYEGCLGAGLAGEPGIYLAPPWLQVVPVDPVTLNPVADGETGLARFVDLGNVDSAVAVLTQDLIRRRGHGIELLGRQAGASLRGCALTTEQLVLGP